MAKIGMEYACTAHLQENEDGEVYTKHRYWGPSSAVNISPNVNDITDYGDDRAVETDKTVNDLNLTVELNENDVELESDILGHEYDEETGEQDAKTDDVAPFLGFAFVSKSKRNNKLMYRAVFYKKVQFAEPNDDNATKQESTTFNHTTYEGKIFQLKRDKSYRKKVEKDSLEEAKQWCDKMLGKSL